MKKLQVDAVMENLETVRSFVRDLLEEQDCPMKVQMQTEIAVEELFVNIVSYAYPEGTGTAAIQVEFRTEPRSVEITFTDHGIPYNPLVKEDPDVTLSADERQVGGLGIYMVKKSMDTMQYDYRDGQNILSIRKAFYSKCLLFR